MRGNGRTRGDAQFAALVDAHVDMLRRDARQGDRDLYFTAISHDVRGRFPARLGLRQLAEAKELALQALRPLQHFAGLRPHPRMGVT